MFGKKKIENEKVLTPDKAYSKDVIHVTHEPARANVWAGGILSATTGGAVIVGGGVTAAGAPEFGVMGTVVMGAGAMMTAAAVVSIAVREMKDSFENPENTDERTANNKAKTLPFSERRIAKYKNHENTIQSISRKIDSNVIEKNRDKTQNSRKEIQGIVYY